NDYAAEDEVMRAPRPGQRVAEFTEQRVTATWSVDGRRSVDTQNRDACGVVTRRSAEVEAGLIGHRAYEISPAGSGIETRRPPRKTGARFVDQRRRERRTHRQCALVAVGGLLALIRETGEGRLRAIEEVRRAPAHLISPGKLHSMFFRHVDIEPHCRPFIERVTGGGVSG